MFPCLPTTRRVIIQDEEETLIGYNPLCSKVVFSQVAFSILSRTVRYILATNVRWGAGVNIGKTMIEMALLQGFPRN